MKKRARPKARRSRTPSRKTASVEEGAQAGTSDVPTRLPRILAELVERHRQRVALSSKAIEEDYASLEAAGKKVQRDAVRDDPWRLMCEGIDDNWKTICEEEESCRDGNLLRIYYALCGCILLDGRYGFPSRPDLESLPATFPMVIPAWLMRALQKQLLTALRAAPSGSGKKGRQARLATQLRDEYRDYKTWDLVNWYRHEEDAHPIGHAVNDLRKMEPGVTPMVVKQRCSRVERRIAENRSYTGWIFSLEEILGVYDPERDPAVVRDLLDPYEVK